MKAMSPKASEMADRLIRGLRHVSCENADGNGFCDCQCDEWCEFVADVRQAAALLERMEQELYDHRAGVDEMDADDYRKHKAGAPTAERGTGRLSGGFGDESPVTQPGANPGPANLDKVRHYRKHKAGAPTVDDDLSDEEKIAGYGTTDVACGDCRYDWVLTKACREHRGPPSFGVKKARGDK